MTFLHFALIIFCLAMLALAAFLAIDAKILARNIWRILGFLFLAIGGLLLLAGKLLPAAWLLGMAMMLLRRPSFRPQRRRKAYKPSEQFSTVQTEFIVMTLDHHTEELNGRIKKGQFNGRTLDSLARQEAAAFYAELAHDQESLALFETYVTRYRSDWEFGTTSQKEQSQSESEGVASGGPMTSQQACDILGVAENASKEEIRAAHRRLMKKIHPDHGGSEFFAMKANQARDLLLGGS